MNRYQVEATPANIKWEGVEWEHVGHDGTIRAAAHYPVQLIVEIPAGSLTGLDLTRPVTITQEDE